MNVSTPRMPAWRWFLPRRARGVVESLVIIASLVLLGLGLSMQSLGAARAVVIAQRATALPVFVGSAVGTTGAGLGSASAITITLPGSLVANDVLVIHVSKAAAATFTFTINGTTVVPTAVRNDTTSGSPINLVCYVLTYVLAGTESGQSLVINFASGGADFGSASALVYRGVKTTAVVNAQSGNASTGGVTSKTTTTITTTVANCVVLSLFGKMDNAANGDTISTPASTTSRAESHANTATGIRDVSEDLASAGATSTRTATVTNSSAMVAQAIALAPTGS